MPCRARSVKRSANKIARTPFDFSAGKTCFMEGTPFGVLFALVEPTLIELATRIARSAGSHTPLGDRQARLSGVECGYIRHPANFPFKAPFCPFRVLLFIQAANLTNLQWYAIIISPINKNLTFNTLYQRFTSPH